MDDRIKVTAASSEDYLVFHTYSWKHKRSPCFYVPKKKFQELEKNGSFTDHDGASVMIVYQNMQKDTLTITFEWLNQHSDHTLSGREETVTVFRSSLMEFIRRSAEPDGPHIWNALSIPVSRGPRLIFRSRKNLKAVVRNRPICRKLNKKLAKHFHWPGTDEIIIYDDFLPYSFYFEERRNGEVGICGGIIYHDHNHDPATARYDVHT